HPSACFADLLSCSFLHLTALRFRGLALLVCVLPLSPLSHSSLLLLPLLFPCFLRSALLRYRLPLPIGHPPSQVRLQVPAPQPFLLHAHTVRALQCHAMTCHAAMICCDAAVLLGWT